jgi:hypothetical protein
LTFLLFDEKVIKGSPVSKPVEVAVKSPKDVEKIEKPAPVLSPAPAPAKQAPAQEATVAGDTNDSANNFNDGRLLCTMFLGFLEILIFFFSNLLVLLNTHLSNMHLNFM